MKDTTKGLILGAAITAIILYNYFQKKIINSNQVSDIDVEISEPVVETEKILNKESEFVAIGETCSILPDFKYALNKFLNYDNFDSNEIYTADFRDALKETQLKGTSNFFDSGESLRKMFVFDIVKTVANMEQTETLPRPLRYEYSQGVLSLGDKGSNVLDLQKLINILFIFLYPDEEKMISENSTYDRPTSDAVILLFKGTSALIDEGKGAISKEFVSNFSVILENTRVNY